MAVGEGLIWWLGFAVLAYYTFQFTFLVLRIIFGYLLGPSVDFRSFGKYACITGATDGIGKAYAFELAARGVDLILISRSESRLQEVAEDIKEKHHVEIRTVAVDFTKQDIYSFIEAQLSGLDIGILINNVGMSAGFPQYFFEYDLNFIAQSINCNFLSAAMMSRIVYPGFIQKSKGLLINISSTAGNLPGALSGVYSSTKRALQVLSEGISKEASCISPGIYVQDVAPCYVATKLSDQVESRFHVLSPSNFVRAALKTVGHLRKTPGCMNHEIETLLLSFIPRPILARIVLYMKKQARALKKS